MKISLMSFLRDTSRFDPVSKLRENSYPILALLVATGIRLLPVILSWPYPVGFDTTALYIPLMLKGPPTLNAILTYPGLDSPIFWSAYQLIRQPFVILSAFGVFFQAGLALSSYVYARKIIPLSKKSSFLTSLVFTLSPITLRLTWDQYRMSFCLIAILIAFVVLGARSNAKRSVAIPLTILVILSNPLPSVFFLISLLLQGGIGYLRRQRFGVELFSFAVGLAIFALQQLSLAFAGALSSEVPISNLGLSGGASEVAYGVGFLIFTSWPLLLFLPFGLRLRENRPHTSWMFILVFFAIALVAAGIYTIPTPFIYLMASFPLAMIVGVALKKFQSNRPFKILFAFALIFLAANALTYVTSSPLNPNGYFMMGQPFRYYMPMGYLQSIVPISDQRDLVHLLTDSISSIPTNSILYLPRQFYGLALLCSNQRGVTIVDIGEVNPWLPSPFDSIKSDNLSYTIWFSKQSGWYGLSSIPSNFKLMQFEGQFGLYQITS